MQIDYIKAIKKKLLKRWLAPMILIFVAFAVGFSILSRYTANEYIDEAVNNMHLESQSRYNFVYITADGKKYHRLDCPYISSKKREYEVKEKQLTKVTHLARNVLIKYINFE